MNKNIKKNNIPKKKKKFKRSPAKIKRLRRILTFILLVTLTVVFACSSFFIVDDIKVTGNRKYQINEVIMRSGLVKGKNVFKMLGEKPKNLLSFRFNESEKNIYESMPYVKSVSIRPSLPKTISIKIEERSPFCILKTQGGAILIDNDGYALENVNSTEVSKKYFQIIGTQLDSYNLGQAVKFKGEGYLDDVKEFTNALLKSDKDSKLKIYKLLNNIDLSEIGNLSARFDNRITVKFGELEDIDYKIRFFKELFANNISAGQRGTIDFTKSSNPYFVPGD